MLSSTRFASSGRVRVSNALARATPVTVSPAFSYGIILLLQLPVIWDVWRYKDLSPGDSASYFLDAVGWAHGLHDNIVWSPLYTDVWGTILTIVKGEVY